MTTAAASAQRLRERIARCAPELAAGSIRLVEQGWDSRVALVDEAWVFRFPRNAESAAQLAVEQALLPYLAPRLPLPIPDFTYACPAREVGEGPFVGYRMIAGVPLDPPLLQAASAAVRRAVARQMGLFLQALHSVPPATARQVAPGLRRFDPTSFVPEYAEIERVVFPLLRPSQRERICRLYAFAADAAVWDFAPALVHNDLMPVHMLFDPRAQRVAGVIDFGDVVLGDPAIDFVGLLEHGAAFLAAALGCYSRPLDAAFRRRLVFYRIRTRLIDLRYHLEHGNSERVAVILPELRTLLVARSQ
ncbi:MAG TPA: phosphotransferase [Herpetosiphonaceae bacterium]